MTTWLVIFMILRGSKFQKHSTKGVCKKSGLAFEALTQVQEQLEQKGQFRQIPCNNCINLLHSIIAFSTLKIKGPMKQNVKKLIVPK